MPISLNLGHELIISGHRGGLVDVAALLVRSTGLHQESDPNHTLLSEEDTQTCRLPGCAEAKRASDFSIWLEAGLSSSGAL